MADSHLWQIDVSVDPALDPGSRTGLSGEWIRRVIQRALEAALPGGAPGQVSVLFTGDATVRGLNLRYRGLDETTDVLSFSSEFPGHWEGVGDPPAGNPGNASQPDQFVLPPGQPAPLGEVIISCPQARRQSEEKRCQYPQELALLVVHGILHLAGFDHLEARDTRLMQSRERLAMDQLFPAPAVHP